VIAMSDSLSSLLNFNSPFAMIVMVILIGSAAGVITAIAAQIGKYASHRADLHLKRELVERGLSVEEIERIVAAKSGNNAQSDAS
jgi:hypothetical protein